MADPNKVTGLTAAAMREIANKTIVGGRVNGEDLILKTKDGTEYNLGGMFSNNPTVIAAAAAKAAELAQAVNNLLKAYSQFPDKFILTDPKGFYSFMSNADGSVEIPDLKTKKIRIGDGLTLQESPEGGLVLRDPLGYVQAWFKTNGQVVIGDLVAPAVGRDAIKKVIAPIIIGQSNAEGRGTPLSPIVDFSHSRIFAAQWDKNGGGTYATDPLVTGLDIATIPLPSQQRRSGLSVGSVIAQELIKENDEATHVVVLNAAAGGSGLVNVPEAGCWKIDYNGTRPQLYKIALRAITKFKDLLASKYPGIPIEYRMYWVQGEADSSTGETAYSDALVDVLEGVRTALGSQTIPIVVGGLVPEWIIKTGAGAQATRRSLMSAQRRMSYTAYTDGVKNGGGSQDLTDTVHYGHGAVKVLGQKMKAASDRAATSTPTSNPHRPLEIEAFWFNNEILLEWSEPDTRWTNFIIQYAGPDADERVERDNLDDGWTTWNRTGYPVETSEKLTGLNGPIKVRIKSVNESLVSLPTIPRPVIGAHS